MTKKTITSLEDLIVYAGELARKEVDFVPLDIQATALAYRVTVYGDTWSGYFDARHAKYLLAVQEAMDTLVVDLGEEHIFEAAPLVQTDVEEGSSKVVSDLAPIIKPMLAKMTDVQTFVVAITAIAAVAGCFVTWRWLEARKESKNQEIQKEAIRAHESIVLKAIEALDANAKNNNRKYEYYEQPNRTLMNSVEHDDAIAFGDGPSIPLPEARKTLPRKKRSEYEISYADGTYTLDAMHFTDGDIVLQLRQEGVQVKAYTSQLSEGDSERLLENINRQLSEEDLPFDIDLQMNVQHNIRTIKFGSVVGFGEPRPDKAHKRLSEIIPKN